MSKETLDYKSQKIPILILVPSIWFVADVTAELYLNGKDIGPFSLKKGFRLEADVSPGKHRLSIKIGKGWFSKKKDFKFECESGNAKKILTLSWSRFWAKFSLRVSETKIEFGVDEFSDKKGDSGEMSDSDKSAFPKVLLVWVVTLCSLILLMNLESTIDEIGIIGTSLLITFMVYITIWYLNEYPNFSLASDSTKYGGIFGLLSFAGLTLASDLILDSECVENRSGPPVCPQLISESLWYSLEMIATIVLILGGIVVITTYVTEYKRNQEGKERTERTNIAKSNRAHRESQVHLATTYFQKGGLSNLQKASDIYANLSLTTPREIGKAMAKEKERLLDFKGALSIFEELEMHEDAKRIRKEMREEGKVKVDQTVVHGDYVDDRDTTYIDDRDTIIKDSVVSKSNIGAGGKSKAEQIKEIKELLDSGAIDKDDYEKMKREIVG